MSAVIADVNSDELSPRAAHKNSSRDVRGAGMTIELDDYDKKDDENSLLALRCEYSATLRR